MIEIKQKNYSDIQIDNSEKDIIQLYFNCKNDFNVVQIEIENIDKLIEILIKLKNK